MSKISNQPVQIEKPKLRTYSKEELKSFGELIEKFYEDYILETGPEKGKVIRWFNYKKLSMAFGATNDKDAVVITGFGSETDSKGNTTYWYNKPTRQQQLENLLDQYYWWKNGQDWVEQKKTQYLESTAKEYTGVMSDEEFNNW